MQKKITFFFYNYKRKYEKLRAWQNNQVYFLFFITISDIFFSTNDALFAKY